MRKEYIVEIYNSSGCLIASYGIVSKDCRSAIASVLVNRRPVIEEDDFIKCIEDVEIPK